MDVPPLDARTPVHEVAELFAGRPELEAQPIVDGVLPVGLVTRTKLSRRLFSRFGYALYERRPVTSLLEGHPISVDASSTVDDALALALARPSDDVYDDVIVVTDRAYVGTVPVRHLVDEQTRSLARAIAERELADERAAEIERLGTLKSRFLAHVTHELRAPVNTLVSLAELIETAHRETEATRLERHVGVLARTAAHLRTIVDNVLDLSKIEAGRVEVLLEPFRILDLVDETAELLRVLARGKPLDIFVDVRPRDLSLVSDPVLLRQILVNLGSNAVKFTDRGTVRLEVERVPDGVHIVVEDTGVGIRDQDRERLFQTFSQVEDVSTRRHGGTGLGLVITRHLVGLLGGRLELESRYGEGTRLSLRLPDRTTEQDA